MYELRGAIQKKISQIVEKVNKGGWGQIQNQKSLHFKCRLLWLEVWIFHIFPNLNYFAIILQYYLYKKCLHFKFFPISVEGGGGHRKSNFSQIQNSPHYPRGRGGGGKKIMDFFHNLGHFMFGRLPLQKIKIKGIFHILQILIYWWSCPS